jgi:hypothetical protein
MSFDWKLYVQLAVDFYRSEALKEAYFRSAISRAYYGVFCIARNFLKSKGKTIPPIDTSFVAKRKIPFSGRPCKATRT